MRVFLMALAAFMLLPLLALADEGVEPEPLSEDELAAGEEQQLPMDPLQFWEQRDAAGGVVGEEQQAMARALTGQHLDWIAAALEAYAEAHGSYPWSIDQLFLEPQHLLLPGLYANPWTAPSIDERDGLALPWGWTELHPGNFSYLQYCGEDGSVRSFVLVGWGDDPQGGEDLTGDGVGDGVVCLRAATLDKFPDGPWFFFSGGREVELDIWGD
jgi:hypothetical protein